MKVGREISVDGIDPAAWQERFAILGSAAERLCAGSSGRLCARRSISSPRCWAFRVEPGIELE
ncbi:MAG: hypothetical protein WCF99_00305 [Chloroflexales bacterium]